MIQKVIEYKNVLDSLGKLINSSPYKKGFIIKQTGITAPTFYRKLKALSFTPDEVLNIVRIIMPEDAYLYDLRQSIKRGKKDYKNGNTHKRSSIIDEMKVLLK